MANLKKNEANKAAVPQKNSRQKSASNIVTELRHHVSLFLAGFAHRKILLGLSGGLDSCVLLDILHHVASPHEISLSAMHIHHGISPNANDWLSFCESLCIHYKVPFTSKYVTANKRTGESLEAVARDLRYRALREGSSDLIAVAHHQDDQAETLLLQLLRGAGPSGLAGMLKSDSARNILRPLLNVSRAEILAYAQTQNLRWINDESNTDTNYARNFVRHEVLPTLERHYPSAKITIARSAGHLSDAVELVEDLATLDAKECVRESRLLLSPFKELTLARQRNLLRWWIKQICGQAPSANKIGEILEQLLDAKKDANLKLSLAGGQYIRRYRQEAYIDAGLAQGYELVWQGEEMLTLPDNSCLFFKRILGSGIAECHLKNASLTVRTRTGGERFKPDAGRPTRTLKHLLQEADIAPSVREKLPLIYLGATLASVPGIGIASHLQAPLGEQGIVIIWQLAP